MLSSSDAQMAVQEQAERTNAEELTKTDSATMFTDLPGDVKTSEKTANDPALDNVRCLA